MKKLNPETLNTDEAKRIYNLFMDNMMEGLEKAQKDLPATQETYVAMVVGLSKMLTMFYMKNNGYEYIQETVDKGAQDLLDFMESNF